jgi:alkanesulfonate monooxygenase SsuD/methylene tetrahydromethanopterin reductase-like flavin-dependent oxidoreductase (luciferase family)
MMRFSVGLPQVVDDPGLIVAYAQRADALGFAGLWTMDNAIGGPTGQAPSLDALQVLSAAAAVTHDVRLGVAVIVMPPRIPALLAKELASLDRLSGGRLTVGVGIGGSDPPPEAFGFPTGPRARRLREGVETLRALWTDSFDGGRVQPKPVQQPLPIWFGTSAPVALRRTARLADGWIGAGSSSSADFEARVAVLRAALREAGRDADAFPVAKRVYIAVEDSQEQARERLDAGLAGIYGATGFAERVGVCGPPEHCAHELRRLFAAGADELLLNPLYDYAEQLERLADVARLCASDR